MIPKLASLPDLEHTLWRTETHFGSAPMDAPLTTASLGSLPSPLWGGAGGGGLRGMTAAQRHARNTPLPTRARGSATPSKVTNNP